MYTYKRILVGILAVMVTMLFASAGLAAGIDSPVAIENVPKVVGLGVGMVPDYLGSDNYTVAAAPFFRYTFADSERYLQLIATELSFNVLNHPNFVLGPVLNYRPGRSDVEDDVVDEMDEIDGTVDLGITAGYIWKNKANPRHRFITSLTFYGDAGDVYRGWLVSAGARYWYPVSKPIDLQIGVGANYGNSQYMDTYFGVSSEDARHSGLKKFEADEGFRDINAQVGAVIHFSMNWHLAAGVKYFGLISDASDSPIVDKRGDANQFVFGLGLAYSW
jgi:outer membrane protein